MPKLPEMTAAAIKSREALTKIYKASKPKEVPRPPKVRPGRKSPDKAAIGRHQEAARRLTENRQGHRNAAMRRAQAIRPYQAVRDRRKSNSLVPKGRRSQAGFFVTGRASGRFKPELLRADRQSDSAHISAAWR